MIEILLLMAALFVAYLFIPAAWLSKVTSNVTQELTGVNVTEPALVIPEDSVLRRHFLTQLRSEIEVELSPRPTDFNLQRHYDALVDAKLENRLTSLAA